MPRRVQQLPTMPCTPPSLGPVRSLHARSSSNRVGLISDAAGHMHHVVIIGGGFGGLHAAQGLKRAPVQVSLVDRRNFHLFQPLLYQVATGTLSPANIAAPL